jgi:hypothetical protein
MEQQRCHSPIAPIAEEERTCEKITGHREIGAESPRSADLPFNCRQMAGRSKRSVVDLVEDNSPLGDRDEEGDAID